MEQNRILLLAVLAVLVIIPIVTAENNSSSSPAWPYENVPEHYLSPEYFKDAKPATPLPESEMITIIISGQTFERFSGKDTPGIIEIPVSYLDFAANFTSSTSSPTWHYEKNLVPEDRVAMIRMPESMYDRFMATVSGNTLELPVSSYVRQYDNLTELYAQINPKGMYLNDSATGREEPGTRSSPTVPVVIRTIPGTQPAPSLGGLGIVAIGCIAVYAAIGKHRRGSQ